MKKTILFLCLFFASYVFSVAVTPAAEGVSFSFRIAGMGNGIMSVYDENGTPSLGQTTYNTITESTISTAWLRPGKKYVVNFQASGPYAYWLSYVTPSGYMLLINDQPADITYNTPGGGWYSFDYILELRPIANYQPALIGDFSGIEMGKSLTWEVGTGKLRNGRSAGRIIFREADLNNSPAARSSLYFSVSGNYGEINIFKDGSANQTLRQVQTPQGLLDLVDDVNGGYWIKCYSPSQLEGSPGNPYILHGAPWKTIRVESPTSGQLKITESEGTLARVSLLTQTGANWELLQGDGQTWLRTTNHTNTNNGNGTRDDLVTVKTGGTSGTIVSKTKIRYTTFVWGEEITEIVNDPDTAALKTSIAYHTDSVAYGNYRRVKSVTSPTDDWVAYQYYDDWNRRGQLQNEFYPWVNSPATATLDAAQGRVISIDYAANATGRYTRQASRLEMVNNVLIGKTITTHGDIVGYGWPREYSSISTYRDGTNFQTDYEEHYRGDAGLEQPSRPYTTKGSNQVQVAVSEMTGTYNSSNQTFTADGSNSGWRQLTLFGSTNASNAQAVSSWGGQTFATIYLIPNKSTMTADIRDIAGNTIRMENWVYTGGSDFVRLSWTNMFYDAAGHLTSSTSSNGTTSNYSYINGLLESSTDATGIATFYTYDKLWRVLSKRKVNAIAVGTYAAQADIYNHFTYDGANHVTESVTTSASTKPTFPGGALDLFTTSTYDLAGRVSAQVVNAGASNTTHRLTTSYAYSATARTTTATLPGGATKTTETFLDGQLKSVSGSAVIAASHTYWIDGSGKRARQSTYGSISSAVNSYSDWLGRPAEEWSIGGDGNWVSKMWHYNSSGQLWKSTQPGTAATLYEYDTLGRLYRQGLDVNANDTLDLVSNDRIAETSVAINPYDSGTTWWAEARTYIYANSSGPSSGTATLTGITYDRLNLASGVLADKWTNDIAGNRTHSVTTVDRDGKKVTSTTDTPDSNINAVEIAYNGLTMESTDTTGVNMKFGYDALGRLTQSIDPRTGTSTTAYLAGTSMVATVTDAAAIIQATYTYDSAGRVQSVKNGLNRYSYYEYTLRNEPYREWGDTTYPLEYTFDSLGRQTQIKTYAGSTASFAPSTWPASPGTPNITTWNYHATTGLLSSKTDANGKSVSFTYTPAQQLATRTWARGVVTNYAYSSTTAELTGITYSDGTQSVSYTYNRLGQSATVADYTGTRTFTYNLGGTLELQNEQLGSFYGTSLPFRITRDYDTATGTVGRYNRLSVGTSDNPYASYSMYYGYDSSGRLNNSWRFPYTYVANSNLIAGVTDLDSNWTQTRTYLSNRDQLDIIETKRGATPKAKFDYTRDDLGRATAVARTGEPFNRYGNGTQGLDVNYGYNDRSELTTEQTKLGGTGTLLTGRDDSYAFDNLGNRKNFTHNGNIASYTVNSLNQYTQRTVPGVFDVAGSAGASSTVLTNGVAPTRQGDYFFQNFQINNTSAQSINSLIGVTPQAKSLNGVYGFNWQGLPVTTPTVTGPTGASVAVLEFGGSPWHVGMEKDPSWAGWHGYSFQNGRTYSFGFWARTTGGTRTLTPMMTESGNDGITSATMTIDTNWRWVTVTKTFAAVGAPRLFYTWDGGGANFQVYGAQVADITDSAYGGVLSSFVTATPEAMTYDFDGNLLTDGRFNYYYDAENRLGSIQTSAAAVAAGVPQTASNFQYDYMGRRVIKTNYLWSAGAWTLQSQKRYLYDGWNLLFELDPNMNALALYVWGLDLSGTLQGAGGVGGLLASYNAADGNWYSPAYDGNGNIIAMIKRSDGSVAAAYEYDAFGNTIRESGPYAASNPFRSATKYTDNETGLVYYGMRYYSPALGRFINRDPIEESGGINLYGFVGNDGVNAYDYLGMSVLTGSVDRVTVDIYGPSYKWGGSANYQLPFSYIMGSTSISGNTLKYNLTGGLYSIGLSSGTDPAIIRLAGYDPKTYWVHRGFAIPATIWQLASPIVKFQIDQFYKDLAAGKTLKPVIFTPVTPTTPPTGGTGTGGPSTPTQPPTFQPPSDPPIPLGDPNHDTGVITAVDNSISYDALGGGYRHGLAMSLFNVVNVGTQINPNSFESHAINGYSRYVVDSHFTRLGYDVFDKDFAFASNMTQAGLQFGMGLYREGPKGTVLDRPPVIGVVRPYNVAKANRIPGYDDHHLDPPLGRSDPNYNTGPTTPVRNDNAGGRVPGGVNYHTGAGGFQQALNQHISELGYTRSQWNALPEARRLLHLRRYYASLGIPFPK